jgi:hypothetical protein
MKPLEASARFAAFAWYTGYRCAPSAIAQAEATRFSKRNWHAFLPVAHEGWGRLLLRIAKGRQNPPKLSKKRQLAKAL